MAQTLLLLCPLDLQVPLEPWHPSLRDAGCSTATSSSEIKGQSPALPSFLTESQSLFPAATPVSISDLFHKGGPIGRTKNCFPLHSSPAYILSLFPASNSVYPKEKSCLSMKAHYLSTQAKYLHPLRIKTFGLGFPSHLPLSQENWSLSEIAHK